MVMRDAIQRAAEALVGKPVWKCTRAADMACFQFGAHRQVTNSRGETVEVGEYALHLQCPWRITKGDQVVIAALDVYKPREDNQADDSSDFDWDHEENLLEERAKSIFGNGMREYVVQRVEAGNGGALTMVLQGGLWFEIVPSDSTKGEHWRLFQPRTDNEHFVVTGGGIGDLP